MREAAIRIDDEYLTGEPAPRRSRPRRVEPSLEPVPRPPARAATTPQVRVGIARSVLRRPLRSLAILAGAGLAFGFFVNALFMQSGPHPAPLFASKDLPPRAEAPPPPPPRSAPPAVAPAPSAPPASAPVPSASLPPPPPPPARAAESAPRPTPAPRAAEADPRVDPIAQFLRSGAPPATAPTAPSSGGAPALADSGARRVAAAQRALVRLGHKVDTDGVAGLGTRAAIQAFERDARLPITGELNPRTLKELASRSGLQIP